MMTRKENQWKGDATYWSLDKGRWLRAKDGSDQRSEHQAPSLPSRERNPFVAFKKAVDTSAGALISPILRLNKRRQESHQAQRVSELDFARRWYGRADCTPMRSNHEATEIATTLLDRAEESTRDILPLKIYALFEDGQDDWACHDPIADAMLAFGGACYFSPDVGDRLPSTSSLFQQLPRLPCWLSFNWFKHSPYSPIQVEGVDGLCDPKWRAAFEDLLDVSLDGPLRRRASPSTRSGSRCSRTVGLEWMLGLQVSGTLPPRSSGRCRPSGNPCDPDSCGFLIRCPKTSPVLQSEYRELVEDIRLLDLCGETVGIVSNIEKLLSMPEDSKTVQSTGPGESIKVFVAKDITGAEEHPHDPALQPCNTGERLSPTAEISSIDERSAQFRRLERARQTISLTLKSTYTTRLPNGTVTTRTVFKRQFEDGTEDIQEDVYTSHDR